ncbi:MAG: cupin domain-containing protein [Pseudomonadota bacterium]
MPVIKQGTAKHVEGGADDPLGPYTATRISDTGGLTQFGALIEELPPGSSSSFAHWHSAEDEMVLVLSGTVTLIENGVETALHPGDAACWPAGQAVAHRLHNRSDGPVRYLAIGTRARADQVTYPDLDRVLHRDRDADTVSYTTRDGAPADSPF